MFNKKAETIVAQAQNYAQANEHEYFTVEHLLLYLVDDSSVNSILEALDVDKKVIKKEIEDYLKLNMPTFGAYSSRRTEVTTGIERLMRIAAQLAKQVSGKNEIAPINLFVAIYFQTDPADSFAYHLLNNKLGITKLEVLREVSHGTNVEFEEVPSEGMETEGGKNKKGLPDFVVNLNEKAQNSKIDPLIGRSLEVERVIQTLVRRRKNNPILVGEAGTGKTAIAEGLALKIVKGQVPAKLKDVIVYSLDVGTMLAGTKYRGDFEERMKVLIKMIANNPKAVLFIDEIHTIVGAGSTSGGGTDASNMLKPKLASGELRVIGATTYKEYRNVFEKDPALARRFQKVDVVEPTPEEALKILMGLKEELEKHHGVKYQPEAVKAAVELSVKHINDRFLPDKAIDILDEAGAVVSLAEAKEVDVVAVEKLVAKIARIPEKTVSSTQKDKLKFLERDIKMVLFGQDEAVDSVVSAIQLSQSGLKNEGKPIGSFLFCGPTGVGKTELAKQISQNLGIHFTRIDMSEYMEKHTVSRLIGAPPGYVGFDQEGLLTGEVIKHPHSVILMDEIEKAHPDVWNILLQVMDHGTLTDNNGRKADFKNTVIIMTSNVGAADLSRKVMGIDQGNVVKAAKPVQAVEKTFSPEFRNRLDGIIYFNGLSKENIQGVLDKYLLELQGQLVAKNVELEFSPEAKEFLMNKGYDPAMGARPMARVIQDLIKKPLSKEILFGALEKGGKAKITVEKEQISFEFSALKQRLKSAPTETESSKELPETGLEDTNQKTGLKLVETKALKNKKKVLEKQDDKKDK